MTQPKRGKFPMPSGENPRDRHAGERPRRRKGRLPEITLKPVQAKAHSLSDKIWSHRNLGMAWQAISHGGPAPGPDGVTLAQYAKDIGLHIADLHAQLKHDSYRHGSVRRKTIPKDDSGKRRALSIPNVRDRHAQQAIRQRLEPLVEHWFSDASFGYRRGRNAQQAITELRSLVRSGNHWVVDGDICAFFDSVDKEVMLGILELFISDSRVLRWLEQMIHVKADTGYRIIPCAGIAQGAVISPLLANLYLTPLDHEAKGQGLGYIRYADDWMVLTRDELDASRAKDLIAHKLDTLGLRINENKTRILDLRRQAGEFLGKRIVSLETGATTVTPAPGAIKRSITYIQDLASRRENEQAGRKIRAQIDGFLAYHADCDDTGWREMYLEKVARLKDAG